ncbi:hypothetical protein [Streptomyces sp. SP18CS02]|uniref:hypothetical protein n=1 Tax=Streptomyces sp. SP18CS02 TaxID=3002531 RepID=UPI002E7A2083|nr:hypothetical protein [Streptomyces sp. SP18CS02]MEE1752405.1 hypothetical protein [Streptomyces sp. SP18CS02]
MSRRVSLPGADELFRTTGGMALQASSPRRQAGGPGGPNGEPRVPAPAGESAPPAAAPAAGDAAAGGTAPGPASRSQEHSAADAEAAEPRSRTADAEASGAPGKATTAPARRRGRSQNRRPSGRERHDEKITVYVSAEELMDLEHARLVLRGEHGLAVDRGRIVREAVAVVLADLESRGDASILVRRLRGR